jgi:hypothetical protein
MHLLRRNRHGKRNHEVRQIVLQFFNHHHKRQYDRQNRPLPIFQPSIRRTPEIRFEEKAEIKTKEENCTVAGKPKEKRKKFSW